MSLFLGVPADAENETVMAIQDTEELYSTVKCLMHDIRATGHNAKQYGAHWMIQIAKTWTIRRWSE
jgi:hypothetical protein